jgi:hypothetical protein
MPLRYLKLGLFCHHIIPLNAKSQEEQEIVNARKQVC